MLTRHRTCWSVVKDAKVVFTLVASAVCTTDTCVPDHDHCLVRVLAAALTSDLDDCSDETLATVLVLVLPVIASYDAHAGHYATTALQ